MSKHAFGLEQPRTSGGFFVDYFDTIIGWERFDISKRTASSESGKTA